MSKADEKAKKYQIIFYPTGFWFTRLNKNKTSLAYIYDWAIGLGLIEIRKWKRRWLDE